MSYAPCKNPACKSYGRPHPNCRCYGEMAHGGEVSYCNGPHQPGCEYYADGGLVEVPASDLPQMASAAQPDTSGLTEVPTSDLPQEMSDEKQYGSLGQQIGAGVEGLAQGVAGPAATFVETQVLGIPKEDIAGRERANPWTHGIGEAAGLAGSMLTGVGEAALVGKAAEAVASADRFGKLGAAVIKGAISNGLIQAGDEVSQAMLGQGDPSEAIGAKLAHVGAAGLFGAAMGGAGSLAKSAAKASLEKMAEEKFGDQAKHWLWGAYDSMSGKAPEVSQIEGAKARKAYNEGIKAFGSLVGNQAKAPGALALLEGYQGYKEDGLKGAAAGVRNGLVQGVLFDIAKKPLSKIGAKYVAPALFKVLSNDRFGTALEALDHAGDVAKGFSAVDKSLDGLFSFGALGSQKALNDYYKDAGQDKLDEYLKAGGIDQQVQQQIYNSAAPQAFAEGGAVEQTQQADGIETHYPEQNIALNTAKGRVSNYLNTIRPQTGTPRLAFDDEPDMTVQEKAYRRALDLAVKPLGIIEEVKQGTVEPSDIKHFTSMYPELHGLLQKQLTNKITEAQASGEKPPAKIRQGLSLLMGVPLSGEFQPSSIQAAQAVFQNQQQPQQGAAKGAPKGGNKNKLTKSDQAYLTQNQALVRRSQKI